MHFDVRKNDAMDIKESINDTRKGFEESFATGDFYNRQTQDTEHLEKILRFLKISDGMQFVAGRVSLLWTVLTVQYDFLRRRTQL